MINQGKVGAQNAQDGTTPDTRSGRTGELVTSDAHARYNEATSRGNVFTAQAKGVTVVAAMASPIAAGATTLLALYNPASSGKNLVIKKAGVATISGTPAGPFYIDALANTGIITQSSVAILCALIGGAAQSIAKAFSNVALTGSSIATTLRVLGGQAAIAAGAGNNSIDEEVAGAIIVAPGSAIALSAHGAGTSHVVSAYLTWEEVPV
jgi:hypothetical protein